MIELDCRRSAGNVRIFLAILAALGIAKVIGMKLGHHIYGRGRDALSNPAQIGAAALEGVVSGVGLIGASLPTEEIGRGSR
jgi:hypothetical protein